MSTDITPTNGTGPISAATLEKVLLDGNLAGLNSQQRIEYMTRVCETLGLNPLTKPFEFLTFQGKMVMYARRDCTEQLRKIHGVSVTIAAREVVEGCYIVTARAQDASGRHDESIGAVNIEGLKGEARSNAMMKAETKAKRRVTLSVCGLGMLDESETESIPGAKPAPEYLPPKGAPVGNGPKDVPTVEPVGSTANTPTARPPRANLVKHDGNLATKDQIAKLHVLKGQVGGLTDDMYRKQLAAFKDEDGKPCQHSNDLSVAQISNLIDRYEAKIAQQAERAEEVPDIAAVVPPMPPLIDLAIKHFDTDDELSQWLHGLFGVELIKELDSIQEETAVRLLMSVGTPQEDETFTKARATGRIR